MGTAAAARQLRQSMQAAMQPAMQAAMQAAAGLLGLHILRQSRARSEQPKLLLVRQALYWQSHCSQTACGTPVLVDLQ